ncbi:pyridoxal-phosphate dependent enzyme, partial [Pseudomonas oryzihabitans]
LAEALRLVEEQGYTFVPPYDDPDVIAGQGTVAMEILRQHPGRLDAIFVPVGGGGLIAGIAAYVKYLRPEIRVIGVEPDDSNCLQQAMAAGERVVLPRVG